MSDIFAMAIGRFKGNQSIEDSLQLGEGVERPGAPRNAINYRNPRPDGLLDYYPFYIVESPNGTCVLKALEHRTVQSQWSHVSSLSHSSELGWYVHENSGMMSLAFVLMTEGKSSVSCTSRLE
jgi:Thermolysin metallopeptidase, alpha-helical domain